MLYEIIPLDPLPGLRGWYRLRGARGTLVALGARARDEHPLVAYGGQVRGRGVSYARQVRLVRSYGKARSARPPCPSTSQCTCWGHMCDLPVRVDGWEQCENPL